MMKAFVFAALIGGACTSALAQTDVLYVTDPFSTNQLNRFQGGSTLSQTGMVSGYADESALAVAGDVRTMAYGGLGSIQGYQYDLSGSYLGTTYAWNGPGSWYDGTTDGTKNYSVAVSSGDVYSFDRDWQSPTYLFTTESSGGFGITYDGKNKSLWVTNTSTGFIQEYDFAGGLLSSFSIGGSGVGAYAGLAWEPSTDTLWLAGGGYSPYEQYSKTGTLLDTVSPSGLSGPVGFYGAEFDIPAPGSLALLGLGGFAAARRRRM